MTSNVFGSPITDSTLQAMPEYAGKNITRRDRARVALQMKNLKNSWVTGSTVCLIYNATGDTVTYQYLHNWSGEIGPISPAVTIANGQWVAFLHVKDTAASSGSIAGVVYRGHDDAGITRDWLFCWYNPREHTNDDYNRAYTEVREKDHFQDYWDDLYDLLRNADTESAYSWKGCLSFATIGNCTTSPIFEGTMKLEGAAP